ncbi:MAG TPA: Gfo/Idh/MocA family oxidoreductase [Ramlibacter sp.]|uniref:Gfo/Idh/MocA family oxidoreductase n=1 Tax=Ramlibacter sp. TaxID=1917967 RepID=UPI002ED5CEAD
MRETPVLAVVGGGRWARVYLSVLARMPLSCRLAVVSRHGGERVAAMTDACGRSVTVLPDLDALLAAGKPAGAVVVNAAMSHVDTARTLLSAGVPVLVEKPAATDAAAARSLLAAAEHAGVALMPALTYLHCSYLDHFARLVRAGAPRPATLRLVWTDPAGEVRYGEQKDHDRGIGIAMDVVPHVWGILVAVLGRQPVSVERCVVERGGRGVELRLRAGATLCEVLIGRQTGARQRLITVGGRLAIDFSTEPGTIRVGDSQVSGDADWNIRTDRPVRRQLDAFVAAMAVRATQESLSDLLETARLAGECDGLVKARQRTMLAATPASVFDADTACAVQELLADARVRTGRLQAGDRAGLEAQVQALRARAAAEPDGDWLRVLSAEGV